MSPQEGSDGWRALPHAPVRSPLNIALVRGHDLADFVMDVAVRSTGRDYGHRDLCLFFDYQDQNREVFDSDALLLRNGRLIGAPIPLSRNAKTALDAKRPDDALATWFASAAPRLHRQVALKMLRGGGAVIVPVALPNRFADYAAATGRIIGSEGYRFVGHLVDDTSLPIDPHVRPRIQLGRGVSARDYLLALAQQKEHQQQFAAATADIDALLTPTTQTAAIPVDQVESAIGLVVARAVNILA